MLAGFPKPPLNVGSLLFPLFFHAPLTLQQSLGAFTTGRLQEDVCGSQGLCCRAGEGAPPAHLLCHCGPADTERLPNHARGRHSNPNHRPAVDILVCCFQCAHCIPPQKRGHEAVDSSWEVAGLLSISSLVSLLFAKDLTICALCFFFCRSGTNCNTSRTL